MSYDFVFEHERREVAGFRFPVYNDLTMEEAAAFEATEAEQAEALFAVLTLAKRISEEQGVDIEQVFALLQKPDQNQAALLADYAAEMQVVMSQATGARAIERKLITVAIRCRGEVRHPDGEWRSADDWTEELTGRLPRHRCAELWRFLQQERNGGQAPEPAPAEGDGKKKASRRSSSGAAASSVGSPSTGTASIGS